ncbi:MAG: hypothetical protein NZM26_02340 [Patescibacteria group bacterium]|nr:hypothetical protein [Patescibacteria group bacterium]
MILFSVWMILIPVYKNLFKFEPFPYDSFTTYYNWYDYQVAQIFKGNLFSIHQDVFPQTIHVLYVFNHPLRAIAILTGKVGPKWHAFLQSISYIASFLALSILLKSLVRSATIAILCSTVFHLSGIILGLSQHTQEFEAYYSLFLSLFFLHKMLKSDKKRVFINLVLFTYFSSRAVLWYHELFFFPLFYCSFLLFLCLYHKRYGRLIWAKKNLLLISAFIVLILSAFTMVVAYEMSLINKTQVGLDGINYGFPAHTPLYTFFSLFFKSINYGGVVYTKNYKDFVIKADPTITYNYVGLVPLFSVSVLVFSKKNKLVKPLTIALMLCIFWFLFSLGSNFKVFYEIVALINPVILKMRHSYYGLKFLYFFLALSAAFSLKIFLSKNHAKGNTMIFTAILLTSFYLLARFFVVNDSIQKKSLDIEFFFVLTLVAILFFSKKRLYRYALPLCLILPMAMLINRTPFSPSMKKPKSDLEEANFIEGKLLLPITNTNTPSELKTVIAFGDKAPTWYLNFLYKRQYSVLSAFDSQGNIFLERQIKALTDDTSFQKFNTLYEIDFIWQMPKLFQDEHYEVIYQDTFWGIMQKRKIYSNYILKKNSIIECHLSKKTVVAKSYQYWGLRVVYDIDASDCPIGSKVIIPSPLMHLAFYQISSSDEKSIKYWQTEYGKIAFDKTNGIKKIKLQYPQTIIFYLFLVSAFLHVTLTVSFICLVLGFIFFRIRSIISNSSKKSLKKV